jgi:hypothetical protein
MFPGAIFCCLDFIHLLKPIEMKKLFFFIVLFMPLLNCFAQAPAYHWEINGVPVAGATSVAFVCTTDGVTDSVVRYGQVLQAGNMLHKYRQVHTWGNILEAGGAVLAFGNLIEMNRTVNPKSNYTPMYCIAGGLALTGYVLNAWIAPGFIARAGLRLEGNGVGIDLGRRRDLSPALSKGEGGVE